MDIAHQNAHGISIPINKLEAMHRWADEALAHIDLNTKTWNVDFECNAHDDELRYVISDMDKLKTTWGAGFPEALISVKGINANRADIQVMGKRADTVKVTCNGISYMFFKQSEEDVKKLIAFNSATFNIVGTANVNEYYGRITPQIFVSDYEIYDNTLSF